MHKFFNPQHTHSPKFFNPQHTHSAENHRQIHSHKQTHEQGPSKTQRKRTSNHWWHQHSTWAPPHTHTHSPLLSWMCKIREYQHPIFVSDKWSDHLWTLKPLTKERWISELRLDMIKRDNAQITLNEEAGRAPRCMGWLRLVGSLKLQVSFAKETYKRDYVLQKRPIILRCLPIVATPYLNSVEQTLWSDIWGDYD